MCAWSRPSVRRCPGIRTTAGVGGYRCAPPSKANRSAPCDATDPVGCRGCPCGCSRFACRHLLETAAPQTALSDRDTIVLADFANSTGDAVFDGTMKVALSVALEQSPFLKVYPDAAMRDTLRLMQQSPDAPITRAVARDVARREQLKALVVGSIASLGSHYVLALEAVDAETGDVMAREQVEVPAKEDVLRALGTATSSSARSSESRSRRSADSTLLSPRDDPIARSASRLRARTRRRTPRSTRGGDSAPAACVGAGSEFCHGARAAVGHVCQYRTICRGASILAARVRAARPRQRAGTVLHLVALLRGLRTGVGQSARPRRALGPQTYSREAFAFNSLGLASGTLGQHERAVAAFRQAHRARPQVRSLRTATSRARLIALNRFDEAAAALKTAAGERNHHQRPPADDVFARVHQQRSGSDGHAVAIASPTPRCRIRDTWQARAEAASGRFRAAHESVSACDGGGAAAMITTNSRPSGRRRMRRRWRSRATARTRARQSERALGLSPRQLHR